MSFTLLGCSLLHEADIAESATIRIDKTTGAHLTAASVLVALKKRAEHRQARRSGAHADDDVSCGRAELRHLLAVRPERMIVRSRLHETRASRRHVAQQRAVRAVNTGQ